MDAVILLACIALGWWMGRGHTTGSGYAPRDRIDLSRPVQRPRR